MTVEDGFGPEFDNWVLLWDRLDGEKGDHTHRNSCRWKVEGKELKVVSMKAGNMGLTEEILMESFGKVLGGYACTGHMHMGGMVVDRWFDHPGFGYILAYEMQQLLSLVNLNQKLALGSLTKPTQGLYKDRKGLKKVRFVGFITSRKSFSVGGLKDVQEVRDQLIFQSDSTKSIDWQQVGATHWEPPLEPAHGWKNMSPNVLKSLYICEYHAGISGSEQNTSSLSESIDKNTSAEKHSRKEN
uniref:Uncharacterized protein n=1 Tax=Vitis vinifera TaxID=29760 RepID=A5AX29_VITVI|nr:hypothetical protein VITISV_009171 [Vitis vinifera]